MTNNNYLHIIIVRKEIKGSAFMNNIIIYTSPGCSYCHEAKEFFIENNLSFIEHNISEDKEARKELIKKGIMSVPYMLINNKEVKGFDLDQIKSLLKM